MIAVLVSQFTFAKIIVRACVCVRCVELTAVSAAFRAEGILGRFTEAM